MASLQLAETGYDFKSNERLRVYLTNTLEESFEAGRLPFAEWLVEEATAAGGVKYDAPVMVVIGNPPYSGHSANKGNWITNLLHSKTSNYFEVDGKPLGERNPKWLNDDYVKFIRFAQWRIERTGYGILAFITNHGYLDNPTFRGMRQCLMQSFDDIYLLDLHGNSKKKERSPDGSKDENVFDIQQGVAIGLFVKRQKKITPSRTATVYHSHLWGAREIYEKVEQEQRLIGGKYHWLAENDIHTTNWTTLFPETPYYLFVPQDIDLRAEYEQGYRIPEVFPRTLLGPNSHRDDFAIAFTYDDAFLRIRDFANKLISDEMLRQTYSLKDTRDWSLQKARKQNFDGVSPIKCIYRPFDFRYMLYGSYAFDYHRPEINDQLLQKNLALISTRQTKEQISLLVTNKPAGQHKLATPYDGSYLSPLYLYPESKKGTLIDTDEPSNAQGGRRLNLSSTFIINISNKLNMHFTSDGKGDLQQTFGPEDIFNYMYAIFHSLSYRARYADFLKSDFPRIPLTSNADLFRELCKLGEQLVGLHVMDIFGKATPNYPDSMFALF
jgi:predicted helicase